MSEPPILDPQPLRGLLEIGAPPSLVQELIELYQEDVPNRLGRLEKALGLGDLAVVAAEAHTLKGALGSLGLQRFMDLTARLEAQARAGRLAETVALAQDLPAAYAAALQGLQGTFLVPKPD